MRQDLVALWADIGSATYWEDIVARTRGVFVPFEQRWPQPGFVGSQYFTSSPRVVVMGQNPRARNTESAASSDEEMFRLTRRHSESRTSESLQALFSMMGMFLRGIEPYKPKWKPITAARERLDLRLDDIAYLNLIPLATHNDKIDPTFEEAFALATERQLGLLDPDKIVIYGKGAYEMFQELTGHRWCVRYIEQRNYKDAPKVRAWLRSKPS